METDLFGAVITQKSARSIKKTIDSELKDFLVGADEAFVILRGNSAKRYITGERAKANSQSTGGFTAAQAYDLEKFTSECLTLQKNNYLGAGALFDHYVKWSKHRRRHAVTGTRFGLEFSKMFPKKIMAGRRWFIGIAISPDSPVRNTKS